MGARTVTVVFTDLVASTATLSALEPAEAERDVDTAGSARGR